MNRHEIKKTRIILDLEELAAEVDLDSRRKLEQLVSDLHDLYLHEYD